MSMSTAFTDLVGVRAPIVCTGMGFVSDPVLAAAASNAGGLGIVAAAMMNLAELESAVVKMNEITNRPYGVNLRSDAPDLHDRARVMIDGGVRVASFALAPSPEIMAVLKEAGLICIPSVGARRHAEKVASWGADAVIVQGGEGGGHTGAVPTSLLLPQIVDSVDIPVVAAGGYFDGRGLVSALSYGAAGIAMGTRFLLTEESPVPEAMKRRYLEFGVTDTVVTSEVDGHPHRVIRNTMVAELERQGLVSGLRGAATNAAAFKKLSGDTWTKMIRQGLALRREHSYTPRQVVMAANAPMLCRAAMVEGREDIGVMSSGQVVGLIDDLPTCQKLIDRVLHEANEVLVRLEKVSDR
ncbi:nitronate monooxygenase [Rhodococcus globerulus]|uniref:NAD(P)H-dependent flavin oxidoreductase n=1 Tax=Rhodococcus globerulus TaxID=33008 RepID=UPI003019AB80